MYQLALSSVFRALIKLQKILRRVRQKIRFRKALLRLKHFVESYEKSKPKIAQTLIKNLNADVNVSYGNKGNSALHLACQKVNYKNNRFGVTEEKQKDKEDMVSLLLKYGANYNALNEKMETPIAYATQN